MGLLHFSEAERIALLEAIDPDDPQTEQFWAGCRDHALRLQWCASCGRHQWPPRPTCRSCLAPHPEWREVEGIGVVFSWTTVHLTSLPAYSTRTPYAVVLAELPHADNARVLAAFGGSSPPEIGETVQLQFLEVSDRVSIPVWLNMVDERGESLAAPAGLTAAQGGDA
jgi:uncharacterized protein